MTSSQSVKLNIRIERWPIAGAFTISRGAKTQAVTVVAEVSRGGHTGRGECVPYPRYGETPEATAATLKPMRELLRRGLDRQALQAAMPAGAARNALDCALLDLEAKSSGQRAWTLLGRPAPRTCTTAYTISLGSPEAMAAATAKAAHRPLLKIKLGGDSMRKHADPVQRHRAEYQSLVHWGHLPLAGEGERPTRTRRTPTRLDTTTATTTPTRRGATVLAEQR